jgi:hypothetical protein
MPNTMLNVHRPFSKLHYSKVNNLDPRRLLLSAPLLFSDFYYYMAEFDRTLLAAEWVTTAASGTAFAYNAQRNGAFRGASQAADNATLEIHQANVAIDSADYPTAFLRFRTPADATGMAFEIGWSDAKTDEALVCVSALTDVDAAVPTIANGITDFGLLVLNTDLSLTTLALIGDGTTGSVVGKRAPSLYAPGNSAIVDMIIGVGPNVTNAQIWQNGRLVDSLSVTNGPDSGTLVRFSGLWKSLDAGAKQIDLLKFVILAEENAT